MEEEDNSVAQKSSTCCGVAGFCSHLTPLDLLLVHHLVTMCGGICRLAPRMLPSCPSSSTSKRHHFSEKASPILPVCMALRVGEWMWMMSSLTLLQPHGNENRKHNKPLVRNTRQRLSFVQLLCKYSTCTDSGRFGVDPASLHKYHILIPF